MSAALAGAVGSAIGLLVGFVVAKRSRRPTVLSGYIDTPHPYWYPGQRVDVPLQGDSFLEVDPAVQTEANLYPFVISAVVPRPIAFVSTLSSNGVGNLAPFSYFNVLGHNPPVVAIGITRAGTRGGGKKDTFKNIEETGEFVVNIISEWFVEAANHTCGPFDPEIDEMDLAGLTPIPSMKVKPPRVKESALHMECKLLNVQNFEDRNKQPSWAVVIGEVVLFHVHEGVTGSSPSGKMVVDPLKFRPVSRLGGVTYALSGPLFELKRPDKFGKYPS